MESQEIDQLRETYDAVTYVSGAFPASHPDNVKTAATLAGFTGAADVTRCRVLEIGCAIGRNLLPMAQALPNSSFLGIDLSPRQIEIGRQTVRQLGLPNVELRAQDLMDFADEGPFDYIIAHGIYSWVPDVVRSKLLEVCGRLLAPRGLAYVSYLTLPGSHLRQIVRDLSTFHCRGKMEPLERVARTREAMTFISQQSPGSIGYKSLLTALQTALARSSDFQFLHDELELFNHAVYFEQFAHESNRHGLCYISDANATQEVFPYLLPATLQEVRRLAADPIKRQQYLDYLEGRAFRASILCRADSAQAAMPPSGVPLMASDPEAGASLTNLYLAGRVIEEPVDQTAQPMGAGGAARGVLRFGARGARVKLTSNDPAVIGAFRQLAVAWPKAVPFEQLNTENAATASPATSVLTGNLLLAYYSGIVEIWSRPTDFISTDLSHAPKATALARAQAAAGEPVITLRHQTIAPDAALRRLLQQLDGTRSCDELFDVWMQENEPGIEKTRARFDQFLGELVANSCLVFEP